MQALLISLLLASSASAASVEQKAYVLGTSINLRKEPSKDAESLGKFPIGTECLVAERLEGEWLKVHCADSEGYAAKALLGAEKPSPDQLRAEARDPKLKLEQREQSALRAAMLLPDDAAHQEWARLFFDRNFDFLTRLKKPAAMKRTFTHTCFRVQETECLRKASSFNLNDVTVRAETRKNLFVVVLGNSELLTVYRGRYQFNKKTYKLTGEVLDRSSSASTPMMEKDLFTGLEKVNTNDRSFQPGQFVLDNPSQEILNDLPKKWGLMLTAEDGIVEMQWNDCLKAPYKIEFSSDIHGRWTLAVDEIGTNSPNYHWLSAVSKRQEGLELTLHNIFGEEEGHALLKLPSPNEDVAYFQDKAYSYKLQKYPEKHMGCSEGGP